MKSKGDTERQASLRDTMIKKQKSEKSNYVLSISQVIKPYMNILDIGCGTAHIIQELSNYFKSSFFIGLDVSPAMLGIAKSNTHGSPNIMLIESDGLRLPFQTCSFDIVISRLAEYSLQEVYRILKKSGFFFEYGLGPGANKEIKEFFPRRIMKENFFFPDNIKEWKNEVCQEFIEVGFVVKSVHDYKEKECYSCKLDLMDLIEMVPLVMKFNRENDQKIIDNIDIKYGSKNGIQLTWHYYIIMARKL